MGQPINLVREDEKLVVYGPNQARVMIAQGWKPAGETEETIALGPVDDLTAIKGVGEMLAGILADAGYHSYASIVNAPIEKLVALDKISLMSATRIQKNAVDLVN